jgi:hypothetical protein
MPDTRYTALNDLFRAKISSLPTSLRNDFEKVIQHTLGIKNLRNVQLWTRDTATRRSFINESNSPDVRALKIKLAENIIQGDIPTNEPIKNKTFTDADNIATRARNLKSYLLGSYTGINGRGIKFNTSENTFSYIYAADSSNYMDDSDDLTEEELNELENDIW